MVLLTETPVVPTGEYFYQVLPISTAWYNIQIIYKVCQLSVWTKM